MHSNACHQQQKRPP